MASNTPKLGLLKKNPLTEGNDTFNIETMLNENWDKIDEAVETIEQSIQDVEVPVTSVNSKTGNITLTASDVGAETPSGAQEKATAALSSANDYTDQEVGNVDTKVGPLANLTTLIKTSIVNAINSLKGEVDEHKDNSTHIPSGLISMWSGLISAIPNGWILCDGQNGTPDLKDRFIMGAITDATINKTGGANTVALTEAQMPSHNHSGSTDTTGSHTHTMAGGQGTIYARYDYTADSTAGKSISTAGAHSHTVTIGSKGSGQAHENRPAYYTLAFIMKV